MSELLEAMIVPPSFCIIWIGAAIKWTSFHKTERFPSLQGEKWPRNRYTGEDGQNRKHLQMPGQETRPTGIFFPAGRLSALGLRVPAAREGCADGPMLARCDCSGS